MSSTKTLSENIIEIKNLKKYYPLTSGIMRKVTGVVKAVDDVSFVIPEEKQLVWLESLDVEKQLFLSVS